MRLFFIALVLCLGLSGLIFAQETTGSINGTVRDATGGSIAGATVTITDPAKNNAVVRTLTTNDDGDWSAPNLPVSVYKITVEATNFKKTVKTDVKLEVGQRRTEDFALEAGNISETVTVEADPVAVNLSTPTAATTINGDQVRELSINNRNFVQLVTLAPGVTNDLDDLVFTGTNNPETQVVNRALISVNGARSTQNTFTVDGSDVTDRGSNLTIQAYPSIDSISEFKVLRGLFPAESGRSGGGQINVVTLSGGKKFHGGAYEFVRNEVFNANDFNTNRNGATLAATLGRDDNGKIKRRPFRYNDYGFTIGGPVYFFNFGENDNGMFKKYSQTFFFFSEEQRRDIRYPTLSSIAPTAALKQGVFPVDICLRATSATCAAADVLPAGTPISSRVPLSNVAQQYVSFIWNKIPNPTNPVTLGLDFPTRNLAKFQQEILKFDHNFTKNWSAFYRFENDKIPTSDADGSIGTRSGFPFVNTMDSNSPGKTHSFQSTYIVRPNLIIQGGYNYGYGAIFTSTTGLLSKTVSPISVNLPFANTRDVVPILSVAGFNSLTGFSNYDNFSWKQNFSGNVTWIVENHSMKFGSIYSLYRKNENALGGTAQGSFSTFNNSPANGSVLANSASSFNTALNRTYQAWANFLQGNFVSFTQNKFDLTADFRQKAFEWYAQDEWKFRPNLSVYYGVRYSFFGSPIDKNGKLSNFVPSLWNPSQAPQVTGAAARVGGNWCNGLIVNAQNYTTGPASFNCTPTASPWGEHVYKVSKTDFAPRFGIAWDPFKKGTTSIRTGYGMYHEQIPVGAIELFLGANPPYQETCSVATSLTTPLVSLDNPVPSGTCTAAAPSTTVPGLRGIQADFKTPYMQHWSLDWQQQVGKKTIFTIGYYGSKGTHLIGNTELNDLPLGFAGKSQCAVGSATLQTAAPGTTVQCKLDGVPIFSGTANTQLDQIRPFRGFRSLNFVETRYNSNYHSLQVSAQRRFTGSSQVNLAYTWSKNLTDNPTSSVTAAPQNTYDIKAEWGRATLDRRHVFNVNFVY